MAERKVTNKYYPPDFPGANLPRLRGPKSKGLKFQTVRIMAPFSMKCTTCGEYIYQGRKFNSRKAVPADERYLGIQICFFYIKCTRCSAEIVLRTDPKTADYTMVRGAIRNMEPWREADGGVNETLDDQLDRLEREEAELDGSARADGEHDPMAELEAKNAEARREMDVADALDEIRHRNARLDRAEGSGVDFAAEMSRGTDQEKERQQREDEEAARQAFAATKETEWEVVEEEPASEVVEILPPFVLTTSSNKKAKKKDFSALLGIKKKKVLG